LRKIKPDLFVLVEADLVEILNRRQTDATRNRDIDDEKGIEEHQFMNRAMSMAYACLINAAVKIIMNQDGEVQKAAKEFFDLIKRLSKC